MLFQGRALLLATSGGLRFAARHPLLFARAGIVAQLGSAAVKIAEALVRSSSELPADRRCTGGELRRSRRPEPGGQRVRKPMVGAVSYPRDVAVRADQHGGGGADDSQHGELPLAAVARVNDLDAVSPWRDVEAAGLAKVEQQRPCGVQQLEDAKRAVA